MDPFEEKVRELVGRSMRSTDFGSLKKLGDAELAALPAVLGGRDDIVSRFVVAAVPTPGVRPAVEFLARVYAFSNCPNLVKGLGRIDADPALPATALRVVDDACIARFNAPDRAFPWIGFWGVVGLAARADPGLLDRLADRLVGGNSEALLAALRVSTAQRAGASASRGTASMPPATGVPQKISEVAAWLSAHPDADPADLAPGPRQRAAAKAAAVRALGRMGGPAAFDVLTRYGAGDYPDAVLKELHAAWSRFDRRDFARAMFRGERGALRLGETADLTGIEAVEDLRTLSIVVAPSVDLGPLSGCRDLAELTVLCHGGPGLDIGVVSRLPALTDLALSGPLRATDLTPLTGTRVSRLRISLDGQPGEVLLGMPALASIRLSASGRDHTPADPGIVEVVVRLAQRGVRVAVYTHEKDWVPALAGVVRAAGLSSVESNGYLGITADPSHLEELESRLFSNLMP